jgi:hypothetical protein
LNSSPRQPLHRRLAFWLGGVLVARLLRVLGATWRIRIEGDDPLASGVPPMLGALWHHSTFVAAYFYRDRGIAIMVSRSRDGDWISAVLQRLGFATPRGSSSRGGREALREQIREVREGGRIAAILCDGPRGPARQLKAGVVALARATSAPLWPVAFSARPCLRFASWDRTFLPLPFARVVCAYGEPVRVPEDVDEAGFEKTRAQLESELNRLTEGLDARLGRRDA